MATINKTELEHIVNGAAFLASGGGGSVQSGLQMLSDLPQDVNIQTATVEQASQDKDFYTAMAAYIGSPDSMMKLSKPVGAINALKVLNTLTRDPAATNHLFSLPNGKMDRIGYTVPVEVGALNTVVACSAAHYLDIPVIDADGAGRAVPTLEMLTYAYTDGLLPSPAILATAGEGDDADAISIHVNTPAKVEHYARIAISTSDYDSMAGLAMWRMIGKTVDDALPVRNTLELTKNLGIALTSEGVKSALGILLDNGYQRAETIFSGRIVDLQTAIGGGFDDGRVILQSQKNADDHLIIYFKNENIVAWRTGQASPVGLAPDTIGYSFRSDDGDFGFSNADIHEIKVGSRKSFYIINETHKDPIVDISIVSPHPKLVASPQFEGIKKAFTDLILDLGYPLLSEFQKR